MTAFPNCCYFNNLSKPQFLDTLTRVLHYRQRNWARALRRTDRVSTSESRCIKSRGYCWGWPRLGEGVIQCAWETWEKVDRGTDGRMILKWILVKQGDRFWWGLICLNIGRSGWLLWIWQRTLVFRKVSLDVLTSWATVSVPSSSSR
jgi:hypothetical protein